MLADYSEGQNGSVGGKNRGPDRKKRPKSGRSLALFAGISLLECEGVKRETNHVYVCVKTM